MKLVLGVEFSNVPFSESYATWDDNSYPPPESLVQSWKSLLNNPRTADVMFKVQDEILCANKDILCGRSEYFKAMFASSYIESRMISMAERGRIRKRMRDNENGCNGPYEEKDDSE